MNKSLQSGRRLRFESLERRSMLSAAGMIVFPTGLTFIGPPAPAAVSTSIQSQAQSELTSNVTVPQVSSLLGNALQNVQSLGQLAGTVASDPEIAASLQIDLASLTAAINQIANNVGNPTADSSLPLQIGVTSSADPQAAAVLNSLLNNVANDLQSIGTTAGSIGTRVSNSLGSPIAAGLSQIDNVVVGLNLLVSGASGRFGVDLAELQNGLAANETAADSEINGLAAALGQAASPIGVDDNLASLASFINPAIANFNAGLQAGNVAIPNPFFSQAGTLTTAGTSALQDVDGMAVNPLLSQPLALTTPGTSPLQDVDGMAENPLFSQPLALTTPGASPLEDVDGMALNLGNPLTSLPAAFVTTPLGGEFETFGLPAELSNPLDEANVDVLAQSTASELDSLDAVHPSDVVQAVDLAIGSF